MSSSTQSTGEKHFYNQEQFNIALDYTVDNETKFCEKLKSKTKSCGTKNVRNFLWTTIPILSWLSNYNVLKDLPGDIVSGITIAVIQIPQSIGSSLLAKVPPINGIYTSIFPVLVYVIFGTSRHASIGTFIIVNIMIGQTIEEMTSSDLEPVSKYTPTQIGAAFCFNIAMIQFLMYTFRLGIISSLLSKVLISGFTCGAAVSVIASQIGHIFGIQMQSVRGYFSVLFTFYEAGRHVSLGNFNWITILVSSITIFALLLNMFYISPTLAKRCPFPFPAEIICVVIGTCLAKYLNLREKYDINLLGHIPLGIPSIEPPPFELLPKIFWESLFPAIIGYTVTVSLSLPIAQKFNYKINFNQELLALGFCHLCGSFFSCVPPSASLSRTVLSPTIGGKTQLSSFISCLILLCVLLWIGPFFEYLPVSVVACIIVITLKGLLMQVKDLRKFWRLSHFDGLIWISTFLATIFLSTVLGLATGFALNLIYILAREMMPYTCRLGYVPQKSLYVDCNRYRKAKEWELIRIFHYSGSINFVTRTLFRSKLLSTINLDLETEMKHTDDQKSQRHDIRVVIVDFSAVTYIDPAGVSLLKSLSNDFRRVKIEFLIAGCTCRVFDVMTKCGFNSEICPIIPSVHEAVEYAKNVLLSTK